jgi:hypothetical protein
MVSPKGVVSNKLNAWCTKLLGAVFDIEWNPETPFVSCVPISAYKSLCPSHLSPRALSLCTLAHAFRSGLF